MTKKFITIFIGLVIIIGGIVLFSSNPSTPAGHEGFVFEKPRLFGTGGFRGVMDYHFGVMKSLT